MALVICVTRIKGQPAAVNPDLIESVESNPDTTICFVSGEKLLVQESLQEIVDRVHEYRRSLVEHYSINPERHVSGSRRPRS
jgi:flagellar protein FlbD